MDDPSTFSRYVNTHEQNGDDLVPRPLQIIMRKSQGTWSASSGCLPTTSDKQESYISSSQPSVQKSHTQANLLRYNPSSSGSSTIKEPLNVRKQRRSDPGNAHSESDGIHAGRLPGNTLSYPPARPRPRSKHDLASSMHVPSSTFIRKKPKPDADLARGRAVTISSTTNTGSFSLFPERQPISSTSAPFVPHGKRRAATSAGIDHNLADLKELEDILGREISRRPSIKQRFVSRMMNGLSNKPKDSYEAELPDQRSHTLHKALPGILDTSVKAHPSRARPGMVSSTTTVSNLDGDFDTVIAAFPTPPSSNITSPTTSASYETSRIDWASTLRKPQDVPVLGVELNLTSEVPKLSSDGGQSIFVALEVKGLVSAPKLSYEASSDLYGLDIAVIIDNSQV